MYAERFDTDDVPHRLLKAGAMGAVAVFAFVAPDVRAAGAVELALAYFAMRAVLIVLYLRAWRHVPEVRSATGVYIVGFTLGAACWGASLLVDGNGRTALWVAGLLIEVVTPFLGWPRFGEASVHESHLEDRAGQFTLIVLGEAVMRSIQGLDAVHLDGTTWLTAAGVAVVILCLWWLTFDFVETVPPGLRALGALSAHIPAYTALAALGVGFQLAFHHVEADAFDQGRWILGASVALYLLGIAGIALAAGRGPRAYVVHPFTAAIALGTAVVGSSLSPPAVLGVLAAALLAEVIYKGVVFGWTGEGLDDESA